MTIDRDQLKVKLSKAIADIERRTGGYLTFVELADIALDAILPEVQRETWAEGYTSGHSRAMRRMSDEPNVEPAENPYRKAASE